MNEIISIKLGIVNAYLLKSNEMFILIDTGYPHQQAKLLSALEKEGVRSDNLKLILITHGDTDHTGNAAFLREYFKVKIAMHQADTLMAETGNMDISRKARADELSILFKGVKAFSKSKQSQQYIGFTPELFVEDHQDLSAYGFDATILSLPGHSNGSIGLLTGEGDLFCGDLFYNKIGFKFIDDRKAHQASIDKLKLLGINRVYPGHGKPFHFRSRIKL